MKRAAGSPRSSATKKSPRKEDDQPAPENALAKKISHKATVNRVGSQSFHPSQWPQDVLVSVLSQLHLCEVLSFARVCRSWSRGVAALLQGLPRLSFSSIAMCMKAGPMCRLFKRCERLVDLDLSLCAHTKEFIGMADVVARVGRLRSLSLAGCSVSASSMIALLEKMPKLASLDLCLIPHVNESVLRAIGRTCTCLTQLDISECNGVDDAACSVFTTALVSLTCLKMDGGREGGGPKNVAKLLTGLTRLEELHLGRVDITDVGMSSLVKRLPSLRVLEIYNCTIGNGTFECIGKYAENLTRLAVWGECRDVSHDGVRAIFRGCPELLELRLYDLQGVAEGQIQALLKERRTIDYKGEVRKKL